MTLLEIQKKIGRIRGGFLVMFHCRTMDRVSEHVCGWNLCRIASWNYFSLSARWITCWLRMDPSREGVWEKKKSIGAEEGNRR